MGFQSLLSGRREYYLAKTIIDLTFKKVESERLLIGYHNFFSACQSVDMFTVSAIFTPQIFDIYVGVTCNIEIENYAKNHDLKHLN